METFGQRLRQYRQGLGLTQDQLAAAAYWERTRLVRCESGSAAPSRETALQLAHSLLLEIQQAEALLALAGFALSQEDRGHWREALEVKRQQYRDRQIDPSDAGAKGYRIGDYEVPATMLAGGQGKLYGLEDIIVDIDPEGLPPRSPEMEESILSTWHRFSDQRSTNIPGEDLSGAYLKAVEEVGTKLRLVVTIAPWRIFAVLSRVSPLPTEVQRWADETGVDTQSMEPLGLKLALRCADADHYIGKKLICKARSHRVFTRPGEMDAAVSGYLQVGRDEATTSSVDSSGQLALACPFRSAWLETRQEAGFQPEWGAIRFFGVAKAVRTGSMNLIGVLDSERTYLDLLGLGSTDRFEGVKPEADKDQGWQQAVEINRQEGRTVRWAQACTPEGLAPVLRNGCWAPEAALGVIQLLLYSFSAREVEQAFG
jgi:DNA-binding XRE family transcriptional regulator